MCESYLEGEPRERCKEAKFVDDNSAALIQRVDSVMPIADELKSMGMLHGEKYDDIKAEKTKQGQMRKLFDSFKSGDEVKIAIYNLLEKHELPLFEDLGGVRRKRKLDDPGLPVPSKRLNTESNEQNNPNLNSASTGTSAPRPAPINIVTNIVNETRPSNNISIIPKLNKMEWKTQAPKKVKTQAPKKVKTPAPKKVKTPGPKKVKTSGPKKVKTPGPKKVKTPGPKRVKTPGPKKVKTPGPKKVKTPGPKKVKTAGPKRVKTPGPKKVKTPGPKKVKTPGPKKVKTPGPKKTKKKPAPKKVKRAAARK